MISAKKLGSGRISNAHSSPKGPGSQRLQSAECSGGDEESNDTECMVVV